jgi:hypothetical protein
VIELAAGGTQAIDFRFGKGDPPRLRLVGQQQPSLLDPVVAITVYLGRVSSEEVKDISLSLEEGGVWRQIPMTLIPAPGGTAGVVMVSSELLRPPHAVPYYVTATRSSTGERFFTEIQNSSNRQ